MKEIFTKNVYSVPDVDISGSNYFNIQKAESLFLFTVDKDQNYIKPLTTEDLSIGIGGDDSKLTFNLMEQLYGYWTFDTDFSDSSIYQAQTTDPFGGVYLSSTSKIGKSVKFNFSSRLHVEDKPHLRFRLKDSFSFSGWILNTTQPSTQGDNICSKNGYFLFLKIFYLEGVAQNAICFKLLDSNGKIFECESLIPYDIFYEWFHFVVIYSGSTSPSGIKIYINGESFPVTITTNTMDSESDNYSSGTMMIGGGQQSNFYLDEFAIWKRALKPTEVEQLYSIGLQP